MISAKKTLASMARKAVKSEYLVWPPPCMGLFYQPERPIASHKGDTEPSPRTKNK